MIRVVIDKIADTDIKLVKKFDVPKVCTKEIWLKKHNEKDVEVKEIM